MGLVVSLLQQATASASAASRLRRDLAACRERLVAAASPEVLTEELLVEVEVTVPTYPVADEVSGIELRVRQLQTLLNQTFTWIATDFGTESNRVAIEAHLASTGYFVAYDTVLSKAAAIEQAYRDAGAIATFDLPLSGNI